jgi:hypothetical protein
LRGQRLFFAVLASTISGPPVVDDGLRHYPPRRSRACCERPEKPAIGHAGTAAARRRTHPQLQSGSPTWTGPLRTFQARATPEGRCSTATAKRLVKCRYSSILMNSRMRCVNSPMFFSTRTRSSLFRVITPCCLNRSSVPSVSRSRWHCSTSTLSVANWCSFGFTTRVSHCVL